MKFATIYNAWPARASAFTCRDESKTVQSQAQDTDINRIMELYVKGQDLPISNLRVPLEGDFADVPDYLSAQIAIRSIDETFQRLPAKLRSKFDNDAGKFFDFCTDKENLGELKAMGFDVSAYLPDQGVSDGDSSVSSTPGSAAASGT